jgi:hypothetical protein
MLELAIQAKLPLIHIDTDDIINVEEVLSDIAGKPCVPANIPEVIPKIESLQFPTGDLFYTSTECKSLGKLYQYAMDKEITIIFINTEKSVLQFDGGPLFPRKELVRKWLLEALTPEEAGDEQKAEAKEWVEELLPCFGGLTLKDVGEIGRLTMTRDEKLTPEGINRTRRAYGLKLRGIQQVDTVMDSYYVIPGELQGWLDKNKEFFRHPVSDSLIPRGLLADGPPGTGKTLAAKLIANEFGVPLYRIDVGSMMGKYVGDSEGNLDAALVQIDQVEPCVVLLDEVEKVFQSTGDSGVTTRMLSKLLWWLQEHRTRVFTVMTTNKASAIPEELHREGRINLTLKFLGINGKVEGQAFAVRVLEAMAKEINWKVPAAVSVALTKKVNGLFTDSGAVPQAKLTNSVYDLIREFYKPEPVVAVVPEEKAA